jgi:hypothetical protein
MKVTNNTEITRWRWYALAVTLLGIILYAMPWLPDKTKFLLAIPLYILFVYVYYKYICFKKAAQALASPKEDSPERQKLSSVENTNKKENQPGKKTSKKGN